MRTSAEFVEVLEDYLKKKRISRRQFCALVDIPNSTISSWKSKNVLPSIELVAKVAKFMNVSLDWLVFGDNKKMIEISGNEKMIEYMINEKMIEIKNDLHDCYTKAMNQLDILADEILSLCKKN